MEFVRLIGAEVLLGDEDSVFVEGGLVEYARDRSGNIFEIQGRPEAAYAKYQPFTAKLVKVGLPFVEKRTKGKWRKLSDYLEEVSEKSDYLRAGSE